MTFLLTDIEGSSQLWEKDDAATVGSAVERHYELLGEAIARHGGVRPVEQGEGDSVVAAFTRVSEAVAAAVEAQRLIPAEPWPTSEPLRVRMALHTGEAQLREDGNYVGQAVNRCARLRELAHGGQVLVSRAAHDLVADHLPDGVTLREMGAYRLRDLARPEQVWQLCHPDLEDEFPPLRSLDAVPHNLPVQLTSFVGREAEIEVVRGLLGEHRLLTLTGAGGCGKTRLSLQVAAGLLDEYPDGVWWIDLAPLDDPSLVPAALAAPLGVRESPVESILETLTRQLSSRQALVVLDNCEHLIDASAELAQRLIRGCAALCVLATSREPLGIEGETTWRVPSLSLSPDARADVESITSAEAVRLFTDRAKRVHPNFAVTDENVGAVIEICRRLDGIPLAIELAASRTRMLTPQQIADGLADRFHLLTGGARSALPRQRTLEASVDWSYDLLDDAERTVFRRIAAFPGSFTLDAAEATCAGDPIPEQQVLDLLSRLVDRSLVQVDHEGPDARYRLLETIRDYARHKLTDADEARSVRERHLDFYLRMAEEVAPRLEGPEMLMWLARLDAELDNLRAAIDWSLRSSDARRGLRLVGSLHQYWRARGDPVMGQARLEAPLTHSTDVGGDRALALIALSIFAFRAGQMDKARSYAEEAVAIGRRIGDARILGRALAYSGVVATWTESDPTTVMPLLEEAVAVQREAGDHLLLSWTLGWLGAACSGTSRSPLASAFLEEGLEVSRTSGVLHPRLDCLYFLGSHETLEGRFDAAATHLDEALALALQIGDPWAETAVRCLLSILYVYRGEYRAAGAQGRLGLAKAMEEANPFGDAIMRLALGLVRYAEGDAGSARTELEQAYGLLTVVLPRGAPLCRALQAQVELTRSQTDEAGGYAQEALALGRATDQIQAIAWALEAQAALACRDGEPEQAEDLLHEALYAVAGAGHLPGVCDTLDALAGAIADQGRCDEAARLLGAAQALHDSIGYVRFPVRQTPHEDLVATVRKELAPETFEQFYEEGAALSMEDAVAYARRGRGERKRPAQGWGSLTPTELKVVKLVVEGLTNPEIGERLFITRGTVKTHLAHVFAKLGVSSRTELATAATRRGI